MTEKKLTEATLGFLVKGEHVWLAKKSRHIGKGLWNGYGGGMEEGEDAESCIKRETKVETGGVEISEEGLEKVGLINFYNKLDDGTSFPTKVHIYLIKNWTGEPKETEEMLEPRQYEIHNLPYKQMMAADVEWLPLVLNGKKIIAEFHYSPEKELEPGLRVRVVNELPSDNEVRWDRVDEAQIRPFRMPLS